MTDIETNRLFLNRCSLADRDEYLRISADPEVMRYFPSPISAADAERYLDLVDRHFDERGYGLWAVNHRDDCIGFVMVLTVTFDCPVVNKPEIGWRFATRAWGQGFASEAAAAVLQFMFTETNESEIVSFTTEKNLPSEKVMQRIGMKRRVDLDFDHPKVAGWWGAPHIVYSLQKSEYQSVSGL